MMTTYDAILWDNDGVLVDTEKWYLQSNIDALKSIGLELTLAEFQDINLKQGKSVFELLPENRYSEAEILQLKEFRNLRYNNYLEAGIEALPGVEETVRSLHGHLPMAIVTSSQQSHFDTIHNQLDLLQYFDFALTRHMYKNSKPYPEPYLKAAEKAGIHPKRCLVIEDSHRGMTAAKEAGMDCFVIPHAISSDSDWSRADAVLSNITEIHKHLKLS